MGSYRRDYRLPEADLHAESRLCTAVGLAAAAMAIITGTAIVMILSSAVPLTRAWPPNAGSWDSSNSTYVSRDGRFGFGEGFVHGHCEFSKADYRVVIPPIVWPPGGDASSDDGAHPIPDDGSDDDYVVEPMEPSLPSDDPTIEDEFPEDPDDDVNYFDNGLAVIAIPNMTPSGPWLSGWHELDGSMGVVRNIPSFTKPPPREPFPRLSKSRATLIVWNETSQDFQHHETATAVAELDAAGFFGTSHFRKPVVLITHGWHGAADDTQFLLAGVRLHSRVLPDVAVMYLNWDLQGATRDATNATQSAWRANITDFIKGLDKDTQFHCVGHSIGSFACAAVCRQFYAHAGKPCARIVALNPYEILDTVPELTQRVRDRSYRKDADYVVVLASSTRGMAPTENQADEYIITNNLAATSEVCDSPDDWGLTICASNDAMKTYCETVGVHNVTFIVNPSNKKMYCASMLVPLYFYSALDSRSGGVPLIRSNPMATSTIIGTLPTVWDSRVYSKDYRFSTFVRNDSVWYTANFGHTNLSVSPTSVFTAVVPYVSNAYFQSALYTAKTRYHNISVYSAFLRGPMNEPSPLNVTAITTGPVLSAYMWNARGNASIKYSDTEGVTIFMLAQNFSRYDCVQQGANYSCGSTSVVSHVPVLRKRILGDTPEVPIPLGTCTPYNPPDLKLIVWKRRPLNLPIGVNVTVTYSHSRQLMAVVLENHEVPSNTTLLTFYDSCESAGSAGMYFDYDWGKAQMTAAFIMPGRYTMRWYFLFEVLEVPVTAYDKQAGLPFPTGTRPTLL